MNERYAYQHTEDYAASAAQQIEQSIHNPDTAPNAADRLSMAIATWAVKRKALAQAEHEFNLAQVELLQAEDEVRKDYTVRLETRL